MDLVVSKVLKKILSRFIRSCPDLGSGNDIKIGTNSSLKLHEIQLKEVVIASMLGFPRKIKLMNAQCSEMNVNVPLSILSKPIDIVINGVKVFAQERDNVPEVEIEQKDLYQVLIHQHVNIINFYCYIINIFILISLDYLFYLLNDYKL